MTRKLSVVAAGAMLVIGGLFAGVAAQNDGASPDRCGTGFEAPGQPCPPTPTPEEAPPTPTVRSRR